MYYIKIMYYIKNNFNSILKIITKSLYRYIQISKDIYQKYKKFIKTILIAQLRIFFLILHYF